jgi:hypothetical protein
MPERTIAMDTSHLHQFMNHPYRKWMVMGFALTVFLVGGVPLTDEWRANHRKRHESQEAIQSISLQANDLPTLRQQAVEKHQLVNQESGINHSQMASFRDQCLELIRKHQCRAESVGEGRPLRQPWSDSLKPLVASNAVVREKPKYEVVTNTLDFTIVGELRHLVSLIEDLQSMHDFFVPTRLVIEQHSFEKELRLQIEMALVEIAKSTPAK